MPVIVANLAKSTDQVSLISVDFLWQSSLFSLE
jgi:hypothetical protein